MKTKIFIYCLVIFLLSLVTHAVVEECPGTIHPGAIPCTISTTWQPANNCNTYTGRAYNENGTFLYTYTLQQVGSTGVCSFLFNQTSTGSYFINMSTGDTATIHVDGDEVLSLGIVVFLIFLDIITLMAPFWVNFSDDKLNNNIIKKCVWLLSAGLIYYTVVVLMQLSQQAGLNIIQNLNVFLVVLNVIFVIGIFLIFWEMVTSSIKIKKERREREEFGEYAEV